VHTKKRQFVALQESSTMVGREFNMHCKALKDNFSQATYGHGE
jgi:hypothetical protein